MSQDRSVAKRVLYLLFLDFDARLTVTFWFAAPFGLLLLGVGIQRWISGAPDGALVFWLAVVITASSVPFCILRIRREIARRRARRARSESFPRQ